MAQTQQSAEKRKQTNLLKYGSITPYSPEDHIHHVKKGYSKIQEKLDQILIDDFYPQDQLSLILNDSKFHYTKYIGKSKNRTMINDDPILYKSLLYHTEFIDKNQLYGNYHVPLSLRLLIAGKLQFCLTDEHYCLCKKTLSFDHKQLNFSKNYCKHCLLPRNSKEHFKIKYGIGWEKHYLINCEKIRINKRYMGRLRISKDLQRYGKIYCPNIGKNEKTLLDQQEQIDNCKIERNKTIRGYVADGYCQETNTVYEVYEHYHRYQKEYDTTRMKEIQDFLKCSFKIIYDHWNGEYYDNATQQQISNLYT